MNIKLIERIYRKILKESAAPNLEGLAAYAYDDGQFKAAVVYDIGEVEKLLLNNPEVASRNLPIMKYRPMIDRIVGHVAIKPAAAPCWGAYEISTIVGPGKIMYGLAYALSPNGMIISDRYAVSDKAKAAWKGMSSKSSRPRKPLDNVTSPMTPDPEDDCQLSEEEYLNYAYESEGWEKGMLDRLQEAHEKFVSLINIPKKDVEHALSVGGALKFNMSY